MAVCCRIRCCRMLIATSITSTFMFYFFLYHHYSFDLQQLKKYLNDNNRNINFDLKEEICWNWSCNFSERLIGCMDISKLSTLSQISLNGTSLLPLDIQVAQCVLSKRKSTAILKTDTFGILPSPYIKPSNKIKNFIKFKPTVCVSVVEKDDCIILKCNTNYFRFVKLMDKKDFWQVQLCQHPSANNSTSAENFAFKKMSLADVQFNGLNLKYPLDYFMFHEHLARSKLVECNKSLLKTLKTKYPSYYNVTPKLTKANFDWLVKLRDLLHGSRFTPMLCSGSLLGWVRECGIIPYTHDFDLMVLSEEFNEMFEQILSNHKHFKLTWRFNKKDDSLEYTVMDPAKGRTDLFLLYHESNYSWYGGVGPKRTKLKWTFPPLEQICSADLLGYLFHVPCNFMDFIIADYGPNWQTPVHHKDFLYYNTSKAVSVVRTLSAKEYEQHFAKF